MKNTTTAKGNEMKQGTDLPVGTQVKIIDPTLVVAFTRTPSLWTAGTYTVTTAGQANREGISHVTPEGIRVAFAVSTDNLEVIL